MLHEKSQASSTIRTFKSRDGVIETVITGRLTEAMLLTAFADLEKLGAGPVWLVDGSGTDSFETRSVAVASRLLPEMHKKGLVRMIAILKSPGMRMAARAVAVASRIDIRIVESRLEAAPLVSLK